MGAKRSEMEKKGETHATLIDLNPDKIRASPAP